MIENSLKKNNLYAEIYNIFFMLKLSREKIQLNEEENEQKNNQGKCMFIGFMCENTSVEIIQNQATFKHNKYQYFIDFYYAGNKH